MTKLTFGHDKERRFDRECVRFKGHAGSEVVQCGVTIFALQQRDPSMQKSGLIPSEVFLAAFDRFRSEIHQAAREKYARKDFEPDGQVKIMVHRKDLW